MELFIFNRELELQGIIENFTTLIWIRRHNESGEFELYLPSTDSNITLLKNGSIIYKKGDDEAGYVQFRNLKLDEKGREVLQVKGKFLTNYIGKRIIWNKICFSGKAEIALRTIVDNNCINTSNLNRKIPLLALGELKNYTEEITFQSTGDNVLEKAIDISNTSGLGYRINLDRSNKKLEFEVYKGIDRSAEQSKIAPTVFSRAFENIKSEEYTEDISNFKNTCLVAGAGEGEMRKKVIIENGIGLDRNELYIDARDLQNTKYEDDIEVTISDTEYLPMLLQRGNEKLEEYKKIETFESEINTAGNNVYKIDYDLGDIITYVDKKWGIKVSTRIVEIEETYEGGKVSIRPTFGTNIPTIYDKVKRMVK